MTVLLQEIDMWPEGSLLLAATNHPNLLDPAVWRRFEAVIQFPLPDRESRLAALVEYLDDQEIPLDDLRPIAAAYQGASFSDLHREVMQARRAAAMSTTPPLVALQLVIRNRFRNLPPLDRVKAATELMTSLKLSQRRTQELTGVSRDTLRKHMALNAGDHGGTDGQES